MLSLNCMFTTKPQILACSLPKNPSSSLPHHTNSKHTIPSLETDTSQPFPPSKLQQLQHVKPKMVKRQPSIAEIERAIGAGIFRERDTNRESEESKNLFESILTNSVGENEGSVEKTLRETGEWMIDQTEKTSRTAGKKILTTMFLWVLPMWIFGFLIASGVIELPFSSPFLQDLIS